MTSTVLAETTVVPLGLQQDHEEIKMTSLSWLFCDLHFESGMERHGRRMFNLLTLRHKESKTHISLKFKSTLILVNNLIITKIILLL